MSIEHDAHICLRSSGALCGFLKQIRFQKLNVAAYPRHTMSCDVVNPGSCNLWITDWYELHQKSQEDFSMTNLKPRPLFWNPSSTRFVMPFKGRMWR